jgi:hypothetical protein
VEGISKLALAGNSVCFSENLDRTGLFGFISRRSALNSVDFI